MLLCLTDFDFVHVLRGHLFHVHCQGTEVPEDFHLESKFTKLLQFHKQLFKTLKPGRNPPPR